MLKKIGFSFLFWLVLTSTLFRYVQKADGSAISLSDSTVVKRLNDSAYFYTYVNTDKSILLGKEALHYAVQSKYKLGEANALISLARAHYVKGQYSLSLYYGTKVSELSKLLNYDYGKAFAVNNSGLIFLSQENFKAALTQFKSALQINKAYGNLKPQASNYFNIALCYLQFNELAKGEDALTESIAISKKVKDSTVLIMAINRLGDIAYQQKQYQRSLDYFTSAIKQNTIQNDWEHAYAYTGMALSLYELKSYKQAILDAHKGLAYAKKLSAYWDMQRASAILHKAYSATGDYKSAYQYFRIDKIYSDSLYNEKKEKEINKLHLRQKQAENEDLQHTIQIKQQKNQLNQLIISIIGGVIAFLFIIVVVIYRKNKQVKELNKELVKNNFDIEQQKDKIEAQYKELSELNHSKDQLFSVIGHDLRSPLVSIIQTVDLLRSNDLSAEETRMVLDSFFEKLTATATMLDNLLLWANNQKGDLSVHKSTFLLPQLVSQLLLVLNFQAKEKGIDIKHDTLSDTFAFADSNHARVILQNLISNAIKFTPSGGNIFIHYFMKQDKVGVVIRDTGVGIPKEKLDKLFHLVGKDISTYGTANEKGIGIGLMLVKKYADENNAEIIVNSDQNGTEFVVTFDAALTR